MAVRSVESEMNGGTAIKEADKLNLIDIYDFVTKSKNNIPRNKGDYTSFSHGKQNITIEKFVILTILIYFCT